MAFKTYKTDVSGDTVKEQLGRAARDIDRAIDAGELLNQQWEAVIQGLTDAQIAQQLFGAQTQAELDQVTDMKQALGAIQKIFKAMEGDDTIVIPTAPNTWFRRLREFV